MSITEYPKNHHGISKKNIPCFGNDKEWPKFHKKSPDFICGIGSGKGLAKAESIFHKILDRSKKNVGGDKFLESFHKI